MRTLPINEGIVTLAEFGPAQIQAREVRLTASLRELWGLTGMVDRRPPLNTGAGNLYWRRSCLRPPG